MAGSWAAGALTRASHRCSGPVFHLQIEQEQGLVFELRSVNRTLQQKALNMGEDGILDSVKAQPLSLLSEIQQSQVSHALTHTPKTHRHTEKDTCILCFLLLTRLQKPF